MAAARKRGVVDKTELAVIKQKLACGRLHGYLYGNSSKLTPRECHVLLQIVVGEIKLPRRRGPKRDPIVRARDRSIATLSFLYEAYDATMPVEAAVAKVIEHYGVARSQVFTARGQYPMDDLNLKSWGQEELAEMISVFEQQSKQLT